MTIQAGTASALLALLQTGVPAKLTPSMEERPSLATCGGAVRCLSAMVANDAAAASGLVGRGAIAPLLRLLERGSEAEGAAAARLLFTICNGSSFSS